MKDFDTELREILKTPIEKRADNFPTEITETALEEAWEKEKENIYQEIIDDIKQAISERLPEKKGFALYEKGQRDYEKQTRERLGLEEE